MITFVALFALHAWSAIIPIQAPLQPVAYISDELDPIEA